jgi:ABC-2 type transport system permease protein
MNAAVPYFTFPAHSKEPPMTEILTHAPRPAVRSTGPSAVSLVGLEIRKSLSTRSGKAVALAGAVTAPAVTLGLAFSGEALDSVVGPIGAMGLVTALVLIPLGVLATAGEWSHRTVQTTFLHVPSRTRVVAAKVAAVALMGAVLSAFAIVGSAGALAIGPVGNPSWDGAAMAMGIAVAAGAAFAVIGAGVGAAMANTPAALTTIYLVMLGAMPALRLVEPVVASKLDPTDATLGLAFGSGGTSQVVTLVGWVVVTTVAGAIITRRRAVQ